MYNLLILLIMNHGCYLILSLFNISRLGLRFGDGRIEHIHLWYIRFSEKSVGVPG